MSPLRLVFLGFVLLLQLVGLSKGRLNAKDDGPLPVVMWHGMGDSCCSPVSIGAVASQVEKALSVYVVSVAVGGSSAQSQVEASFFGNALQQVDEVCASLMKDEKITSARGVNLVGFSQGGIFVRALVERCDGLRAHNVITLGGPHQGVMEVPNCSVEASSVQCSIMRSIIEHGAYLDWVQSRVIQAQYFKDATKYETYLEKSLFLADINNERTKKNEAYSERLKKLNRLVLFRFSEDTTVVPRDSAWFSFFNGTDVVPLSGTELYKEDYIGLKELDEEQKIVFETAPGPHMHFTLDWFSQNVIKPYLSPSEKIESWAQ